VQRLLLGRRLRLAATATLCGAPVLLTHAGVTVRELTLLGLQEETDCLKLAAALNGLLDEAVATVGTAWIRGEPAALDLSPVHVTGTLGREGGGLLYHRPARRNRANARDVAWEFDVDAPRRFEPQALPAGLIQVAGHSGHGRCFDELEGWIGEGVSREPSVPLRTIQIRSDGPRYVAGVAPTGHSAALVLIDAGFAESPLERIELLPLQMSASG